MTEQKHNDHHSAFPSRDAERRTMVAFVVTFLFALVEIGGGLVSGSLTLLADALHMLADASALFMAWGAFRLGRMAADSSRSYGYRRWEVLAALINSLSLLGLSGGIIYEAVLRLNDPRPVEGWSMLVVAAIGLAANYGIYRVLGHEHGHDHDHDDHHHEHDHAVPQKNLNLEGALLHVLGDLLGSAGAVAAAGVILVWGWTPIDPILSIVTAVIILGGAVRLSREAIHILLEGSPRGFDSDAMARELVKAVPGLVDIHHIHAWSLSSGQSALTLHAVVETDADRDVVLARVQSHLADHMGFPHSVVQIEGMRCEGKAGCI